MNFLATHCSPQQEGRTTTWKDLVDIFSKHALLWLFICPLRVVEKSALEYLPEGACRTHACYLVRVFFGSCVASER